MKKLLAIVILGCIGLAFQSAPTYKFAMLKYSGGGDWYANPTALTNLIGFCNSALGMNINREYDYVDVSSPDLFSYPFVHMTGHGNVIFSNAEAINLRNYLKAGGFLHISDNYGLDKFIRTEMQKVLPDAEWVELPFEHPIYKQTFTFNTGLPKIHEHDGSAPRGYGLFDNGSLVVFYDTECDLGDGWEDASVHNDPQAVRQQALRMGANIVQFALTGRSEK